MAEVAGAYMFHDQEYINRTRDLISSERKRIYEELKTWKHVKVYEPHAKLHPGTDPERRRYFLRCLRPTAQNGD